MRLRICTFGEPILRTQGKTVTAFDLPLRHLTNDMIETMHANQGIGLAAQQIGRDLQLCMVDISTLFPKQPCHYRYDGKTPPIELLMPLVLINPVVKPVPEPQSPYNEGCLSFPGILAEVFRPERIHVAFHDWDGQPHELSCDGLLARVIQHEVDHLNGILFIDRMEKRVAKSLQARLKKLQRQTRDQIKSRESQR